MTDPAPLKPGWRRVKFGDVVRLSKSRSQNPLEDGYDRYVGLEHLEPGDLRVRSWGNVADGTTFTSVFQPGQVLFGKRRAYQRKVAVADFAGVCSGDIYVLESKDPQELLPELLPFICQTDAFFEHAVGTSAGSLSPRTNWGSLADFEFALPPLKEQSRIVDLFKSLHVTLNSYVNLIQATNTLYYSLIDEKIVGHGELRTLERVTTKIVDGVHKTPKYTDSGVPFLVVENLTGSRSIDFSKTRYVSQRDHEEYYKRANPELGDVLVSKDGTLGVARIVDKDRSFSIFVSLALIKPKKSIIMGDYLRYFFDSRDFRSKITQKTSGSAIKHIHLKDFRETKISVPSLDYQEESVIEFKELERALEFAEMHLKTTRATISCFGTDIFRGI